MRGEKRTGVFNNVVPQKQQGLLGELVVLEALTVGRLLHPNNAVPLTLLHLQEVGELHRLHLMDRCSLESKRSCKLINFKQH